MFNQLTSSAKTKQVNSEVLNTSGERKERRKERRSKH